VQTREELQAVIKLLDAVEQAFKAAEKSRSAWEQDIKKRDATIMAAIEGGATIAQVAASAPVSIQRIKQIAAEKRAER